MSLPPRYNTSNSSSLTSTSRHLLFLKHHFLQNCDPAAHIFRDEALSADITNPLIDSLDLKYSSSNCYRLLFSVEKYGSMVMKLYKWHTVWTASDQLMRKNSLSLNCTMKYNNSVLAQFFRKRLFSLRSIRTTNRLSPRKRGV